MKEENLNKLFENLRGTFDTEEPADGHEDRFLSKLNQAKGTISINTRKPTTWWRPLSIAASVMVLCVLALGLLKGGPSVEDQVAEISPEVSETRLYFTGLIEQQVQELQGKSSPETELLITDTVNQLKKLEADYLKLEQDLINGGDSKLILSAMINNFQTRIDLLQEVMNNVETIQNLNYTDDESFTI